MAEDLKEKTEQEPRQIVYVQHIQPEEDEVEIDLMRVMQIFWQQRKKAVLCVVACALAGLVAGMVMPKHYESTVKLSVSNLADGSASGNTKNYLDGLSLKEMPAGAAVKQDAKTNAITVTGSGVTPEAALENAQAGVEALRAEQKRQNEERFQKLNEYCGQNVERAKQEADEAMWTLEAYGREHAISIPASAMQGGDEGAQGYVMTALNVQGADKDSVKQYLALFNEAVSKQVSYTEAVSQAEFARREFAVKMYELEEVSAPQLPRQPVGVSAKRNAGLGAVLGLLLSFVYAFYLYWPELKRQKQE